MIRLNKYAKLIFLFFIGFSTSSFGQEEEANPAEMINEAFNQYANLYQDNCAVCHGDQLQCAAQGAPLGLSIVSMDGTRSGYLDGSIPADNPYSDQEGVYKSI